MAKQKPYFEPVDPKVDFPSLEEKVLTFWKENKIFEKSLEKNRNSDKNFTFYEGPPTANGRPGIHHVEARSFKDVIPRYKTMRGYGVPRQAGWDCHGLPVELQVEKQLGISGKPQIEEYGIKEFNELCRKSVLEYVDEWTKLTKRMAYWVDTENPYWTMDNSYIEKEWGLLAQMWEKGLLYEDYKVVPYCPRCGTSLSSHELAQGYKDDVEDPSLFVKFKLKNTENDYFVAWTTTPWTLPGNVALAVDEKAKYIKVKTNSGNLILSAKRAKDLNIEGEIVEKFSGKDLLNKEYEPLFDFVSYEQKAHFVISADFVSMDEGTGIVHTAVMYGEDDFRMGEKFNLPKKHVVSESGEFVREVTPWAGKFVKNKTVEKEIIEKLKNNGNLFRAETIRHTYPFCWRCGTPLLYYAVISWYLRTTIVKEELIKNNNSVNWVPEHIKEGRMGEWLSNNRDWALSRSRYWGTPLPVWQCEKCNHTKMVGGVSELSELAKSDLSELDLHRPFIDEIIFKCSECDGEMRRVDFVLDCWFDSGAMPFAGGVENFPADFISEAIDQTRGWFYTLQAVATLLGKSSAYKNVICLGHLLDEKGNKMSKSKGNVVDPWEIMNSVGADATRWYMYSTVAPGPSFRFSENLVKDVTKRFLLILWNSYNYLVTYANLNGWRPLESQKASEQVLDRWVLVGLQDLVNKVTRMLDKYDLYNATREIEDFVAKDLSQWYIRRSRGRVDEDFFATLHRALLAVSKLIAPFAPFVAEEMYRNLSKEASVHLADWPEEKQLSKEDVKLLSEMQIIRKISEKAHSLRKEAGVALRQPLASLTVKDEISDAMKSILADELNVKAIRKGEDVNLDTTVTSELKAEGEAREVVRQIQDARKKLGTKLDQMVDVALPDWPREHEEEIKKRALVDKLIRGEFAVTPK